MVEFDELGQPIVESTQQPQPQQTVAASDPSPEQAPKEAPVVEETTPTVDQTPDQTPEEGDSDVVVDGTEEPKAVAQEAVKEEGFNAGEFTAKAVETVFGRGPVQRGLVRGVEDIYNFASWAGDTLERATGIEKLLDASGLTQDGMFSNDPTFGRGAVSEYMYESQSGMGKAVEGVASFVPGYLLAAGPANAISQAGGSIVRGAMNIAPPKFTGMVRESKTLMSIIDKAKNIVSNPNVAKFNEGGMQGALADFALTQQEDELISEVIGLTKAPIRETYLESLTANDPPSLMERKLKAVMEGYLMGGVANHVVDDLLTFFSRARQNGIIGMWTNTPEQQATLKAMADGAGQEDKLVGKIYEGEKIVKVVDSKGKSVYAKESQVVDIEGVPKLKAEDSFIAPADIQPYMDPEQFTPDVTEYLGTWMKKYDEAGRLSKAATVINEGFSDNSILRNTPNILTDIDNGSLKKIGGGTEANVYDGGDFVVKTPFITQVTEPADAKIYKESFKDRFEIEATLADKGLAPNTYQIVRENGDTLILQDKVEPLSDYAARMYNYSEGDDMFDILEILEKHRPGELDNLVNKINDAGFDATDVYEEHILRMDNLGISKDGKLVVIDAGEFKKNGRKVDTSTGRSFKEKDLVTRRSTPLDSRVFTDRSMDVIDRIKAIVTGTDTEIMEAIKRGDTYGIFRSFRKKSVSMDSLAGVVADYGYNIRDIEAAFPNVSAEKIGVYFYKIDNAVKVFDQFVMDNADKIRNLDTETLALARQASDMVETVMADFDNLGTLAGQSLSIYGHHKRAINANLNQSIHKFRLQGVDIDALLKKVDAYTGLDENQMAHLSKKTGSVINDILYTNYVSNLLYGAVTHGVNSLSGSSMLLAKNLGRAYVAVASTDAASAAGARAFLRKGIEASTWTDSFSEAWRALRSGKIPDHLLSAGERAKSDEVYRVYREMARQYSNIPILGATLKAADWVVTRPGHVLTGTDVFFKQFKYNQGLADGVASALTRSGKSVDEVTKALGDISQKRFTDNIEDLSFKNIVDNLERETSEITFTMKPNEMMGFVNKGIDKIDIGGIKPLKFLIPFARIDMNIVRYTAQTMPGIGMFSKTNQNIFMDGTIEAQERRIADMMATSTMILGGGTLLANGMMTGSGPSDQREKAALVRTGWKPYSLYIPGYGYLELRRLGAVGNFFAMGAWVTELMDSLPESDDVYAEALASTLGMMTETFTPKFVSETMPKALNVLNDPSDERKMSSLLQIVADITPNAAAPGTGAYSRNSQLFGQGAIMEFDFEESRLATAFYRAFPMFDVDHKPQVDFLGNDRNRSPLHSIKDMDLISEYERLTENLRVKGSDSSFDASLVFTLPRRNLERSLYDERGKVFKFTNEQYYRYQKYAAGIYDGSETGAIMEPFKDAWRREMISGYPEATALYGSRSDEAVTTWLRDLKGRYNELARGLIQSEYEVSEGINKGIEEAERKRSEKLQRGSIRVR